MGTGLGVTPSSSSSSEARRYIPVEEKQDGEHGLVDVAVTDALVEQEAGVTDDRLQRVLPHDVVQLVRVQVLVHQLVPELAEVADTGAPTGAPAGGGGPGVITAISQVQTAAAAVQANGRAAVVL